jgi:1,5-anhydro-D-fructose reductase (1,5-anhydro-D-mannitol-forming)
MPLKFALLGTGRIANDQLAPALAAAPGAELWSVLSRDLDRARDFARRHGARAPSPAYADLDRLLADPALDAVLIATPDKLHAAQAIRAARAGKHVLCEKPMVTSAADGRAMIDACKRAGIKLGVAYHMRWHDGHRSLARAAREGAFGELRHMRVLWSYRAADASNWRASSEVGRWWSLGGVGTHLLDQIRWFLCPQAGEVVEQSSVISRGVFRGPHDETALLALRFESGATAELCSSVLFAAPRRFELYGSDGYAVGEDTLGAGGDGSMWTHDGPFEFEVRNPYVGEIEDFVAAVAENRAPEVDGEEGLRNCELLLEATGEAA